MKHFLGNIYSLTDSINDFVWNEFSDYVKHFDWNELSDKHFSNDVSKELERLFADQGKTYHFCL